MNSFIELLGTSVPEKKNVIFRAFPENGGSIRPEFVCPFSTAFVVDFFDKKNCQYFEPRSFNVLLKNFFSVVRGALKSCLNQCFWLPACLNCWGEVI